MDSNRVAELLATGDTLSTWSKAAVTAAAAIAGPSALPGITAGVGGGGGGGGSGPGARIVAQLVAAGLGVREGKEKREEAGRGGEGVLINNAPPKF